jgi:hypothetical protein
MLKEFPADVTSSARRSVAEHWLDHHPDLGSRGDRACPQQQPH